MPGVANWVSNVRMKLFQDGFESVWMNQGVGRVREFIRAFREKVVDSRWQNWEDRVQTSDRISMYRSFVCTHTHTHQNVCNYEYG